MLRKKFDIYRPPKPTGRLEGEYYKNQAVWAPSIFYQNSIEAIRDQMTPAQAYRHKLQTTGKEQRILRRLEWRWERDYEGFSKAARCVQAAYRGMTARHFISLIREELVLRKEQREAVAASRSHFEAGELNDSMKAILGCRIATIELRVLQAKIYYRQEKFDECATSAQQVIGKVIYCRNHVSFKSNNNSMTLSIR